MAATLSWTETAVAHLADIAEYIAQDSPRNAERVVERIVASVEGLRRFPFHGHIVPEFGREDLRQVIWRKYRIVYRAGADAVLILAVVHGARRLEDVITDEPDDSDSA
jgi:toxin ParE1/3/4